MTIEDDRQDHPFDRLSRRFDSDEIEKALLAAISIAFLALLVVVDLAAPTGPDRWLAGRIQSIPWGDFEFVPAWGSEIGGGRVGFFVVPITVAIFFALRQQWRLLLLLGVVFALHYVAISPKAFIPAERPSPIFGVEGGGGLESFPSGHVQWAVSFYGFMAFLALRLTTGYARLFVLGAYALVVASVMIGRIELGRHWPIDTMGGLLIGLLCARLLVYLAVRSSSGNAGRVASDLGVSPG
jgi:membrane-associated phospholipid phosphatase